MTTPQRQFELTVPASIANLGPGFDTLAVAVQLYLRLKVQVLPGHDQLEFRYVGTQLQGENYIERSFRFLARQTGVSHPSMEIEVCSDIPMRSGLGSSAAATVAGLRLYEALYGALPSQALLNAACTLEGHPDNAAAALLGGLTASCQLPDGSAYAAQFRWPAALKFVVVTPNVELATSDSRRVLPTHVPRADAVFNLQRLALLLQILQNGDFSLLRQALSDRLHQPFRQPLVPGLEQALNLEHESMLGVCLSGAGPSIVAFAEHNVDSVAEALSRIFIPLRIDFEVRTLAAHQPAFANEQSSASDECTMCA